MRVRVRVLQLRVQGSVRAGGAIGQVLQRKAGLAAAVANAGRLNSNYKQEQMVVRSIVPSVMARIPAHKSRRPGGGAVHSRGAGQ